MSTQFGQHFIVGFSGQSLTDAERKMLKELAPLGTIIFAHNIDKNSANWATHLQDLINEAKELSNRKNFLVSIDHEGGRVHRLTSPITKFPPARTWHTKTAAVATAMARELRALGINLSFSPVLDVHSEPENTVIGNRAFAENADEVSSKAMDFFVALEAEGVLACGKHFPGHGATIADSHYELPQLNKSKTELLELELKPFKALIESGIQLLMTAHILYPALDKTSPATISETIINGLLRKELGYNGAVISDALEMNALGSLTSEKVAVSALNAGVDILLVGQAGRESADKTAFRKHQALVEAANKELLSKDALSLSNQRIENMLHHLQHIQQSATRTAYSLDLLGCKEHQELCGKITSFETEQKSKLTQV